MSTSPISTPELVFSHVGDAAQSRRVRRQAAAGDLRKLHTGIYTPNLHTPPEQIVERHWREIVGHLLPGGVISHRSAFEGRPHDGLIVITRGQTRRTLQLPGLQVEVLPGPGAMGAESALSPVSHRHPQRDASQRDAPYGALFLASEARRFLENLSRGRAWSKRVLPQDELEAQLEKILALRGEERFNALRDACRQLAPELGLMPEYKRLDALMSALLGTQSQRKLTAKQALARAAGRPYDPDRLTLFDALFAALNREVFAPTPDPAPRGVARDNFAFYEAYFSNFIEGTTFTVEEAERIVFERAVIENRSADSHDVRGTFEAAARSPWRDTPAHDADGFLAWLKSVHALVMRERPDKKPGEWKEQINQAGTTVFVLPELVPGTLRQGFERVAALIDPMARALMTMFVVTEVHPFTDGNGRTARLAMNCALSASAQCRIVVPTVYRDDYVLPLKALSNHADPLPLIRSMTRIQRWSAAFDYSAPREVLRGQLTRCNAFADDTHRFQLAFPDAPG